MMVRGINAMFPGFSLCNQICRRSSNVRYAPTGFLLILLLLLVLPSSLSTEGRFDSRRRSNQLKSTGSNELDCKRVQKTFVKKGFPINHVSGRPMPGGDLAVCNLGMTCCTKDMEQQLVLRSAQNIRTTMAKQIRKSLHQLTRERDALVVEVEKLLNNSYMKLHEMYSKTYGYIYLSRKSIITDMYDRLKNYFSGKTEDLGRHIREFFMELQKTMLSMMDKESRNDRSLTNCLLTELSKSNPFDDVPDKLTMVLRRTLVTSRTFVMVLSHMRDLLQQILDRVQATLSRECINSLTRLHMCPVCAGMQGRPCPNFCKNVMRGCLYQLYDIIPAWSKLIKHMNNLAKRMSGPLIIENNLNSLGIKVSDGIMNFQKNYNNRTRARLRKRCQMRRQPRSAPYKLSRDRPRDGRSRKGRGRNSFGWEYGIRPLEMAKLVRNIKDKILRPQMHIWTSLMTSSCHGRKAHCWNGTALSSYDHKLVGNNRRAQVSNPEVAVDTSANDPTFAKSRALMEKLAKSCEQALENKEVAYIAPSPVSTTFPRRVTGDALEGSGLLPNLPSREKMEAGSGLEAKPRSTNGPLPVMRPMKLPLPSIRRLPPDDDDTSRLVRPAPEGSGLEPTVPSSTHRAPSPSTPRPRLPEWRPKTVEGSGMAGGPTRPQVVDRVRAGPGPDEEGSGRSLERPRGEERPLPVKPVLRTELKGPVPNSVWVPKSPESLNGYQVRSESGKKGRAGNVALMSSRPVSHLVLIVACALLYRLLTDG